MIYDITQPLFECVVFPGDPAPERKTLCSIEKGDPINLTALSMCAHNGTHVDAPMHFIKGGKGIDEVALERFIGKAYVCHYTGDISASDAEEILARAQNSDWEAARRILVGGKATLTLEAARVFANAEIYLYGNESQTVGPENAPRDTHMVLLGAEVVLLEGIRLSHVPDGVYLLHSAPLNLTRADGAPCRATLIAGAREF